MLRFMLFFSLGALAAAVAAELIRRVRARVSQLRPGLVNPYFVGRPATAPEMFFGRDEVLERIIRSLPNNHLLIHGEARIGKSTVLHHLAGRLGQLAESSHHYVPVLVDVHDVPEPQLASTLGRALQRAGAADLGLEHGAPFPSDPAYTFRHLTRDLRRLVRQLVRRHGPRVRLVVLLDHVEQLDTYDERTNQQLRSLLMKGYAEHLACVAAGVEVRREWSRAGSPWYNVFEEIELTALATADALALVTEPVAGRFEYAPGVAQQIVAESDGRPERTQRTCHDLIDRAIAAGQTTITFDDLLQLDGAPPLDNA